MYRLTFMTEKKWIAVDVTSIEYDHINGDAFVDEGIAVSYCEELETFCEAVGIQLNEIDVITNY